MTMTNFPNGIGGPVDETKAGTIGVSIQLLPTASAANGGVTHKLVSIGDNTGNTAFGFGDPTKQTTGLMASFGRTAVATSAFTGVDTGADIRVFSKLANNAAYAMQGVYVKAKNYSGSTVGVMKGIDLEYVNEGTATEVIGLNIRTPDTVAGSHSDIKLSNGVVITSGGGTDDTSIKADVGTLAAGSIYLATNGKVWVMVTTTWTQLTIN